jgi:hypothetical protein
MHKAIILLLVPVIAFGQSEKKIRTGFALGPVFSSQLNAATTTGLSMLSSLEYHFSDRWAVWGAVDFQTFSYTKKEINYSLRDKVSSIPFTAGAYYSISKNKVSAYLLAGGGITIISIPKAEIDVAYHIKIKKENTVLPAIQLGCGINWKLKPVFIPFIEPKIISSLGKTSIANNNFTVVSLVIGFRSELF